MLQNAFREVSYLPTDCCFIQKWKYPQNNSPCGLLVTASFFVSKQTFPVVQVCSGEQDGVGSTAESSSSFWLWVWLYKWGRRLLYGWLFVGCAVVYAVMERHLQCGVRGSTQEERVFRNTSLPEEKWLLVSCIAWWKLTHDKLSCNWSSEWAGVGETI